MRYFLVTLFLPLVSLATVTGSNPQELLQEHLHLADSYYWLSRDRENSLRDIKANLDELSKARRILGKMDQETPGYSRIKSKLERAEQEVQAQQAEARRTLGNKYVGSSLFLGTDNVVEFWEDAQRASARNAMAALLEKAESNKATEFGLPMEHLLYLVVEGEGCSENLLEYARSYLTRNRDHYIFARHEYPAWEGSAPWPPIKTLKQDPEILKRTCEEKGLPGIGVLMVGSKEPVTGLHQTELDFIYWDNTKGTFGREHYALGFGQAPGTWSKAPYLLLAFPFLAVFPFRKLRIRKKKGGLPAPLYVGVLAAVVAMVLAMASAILIGLLQLDLADYWKSPKGIGFILLLPLATTLVPMPLVFLGLSKLPTLKNIINKRDVIALSLLGAYTGGFLPMARFTVMMAPDPAVAFFFAILLVGVAAVVFWYAAPFLEAFFNHNHKDMLVRLLIDVLGLSILAGLFYAALWIPLSWGMGTVCILTVLLHTINRKADKVDREGEGDSQLTGMGLLQDYLQDPDRRHADEETFVYPTILTGQHQDALKSLEASIGKNKQSLQIVEITGVPGSGKYRFAAKLTSSFSNNENFLPVLDATFRSGDEVGFPSRLDEFVEGLPPEEIESGRFSNPQDKMDKLGEAFGILEGVLKMVGMGFLVKVMNAGKKMDAESQSKFYLEAFFEMLEKRLQEAGNSKFLWLALDNMERLAETEAGKHFVEGLLDRLARNFKNQPICLVATVGKDAFGTRNYYLPLVKGLECESLDLDTCNGNGLLGMEGFTREALGRLGFDNHSRFYGARELAKYLHTPIQLVAALRYFHSHGAIQENLGLLRFKEGDAVTRLIGRLKKEDTQFIHFEEELGSELYRILRCSAIVAVDNRRFRVSVVADILGETELDILEKLDVAEEKGLVEDCREYDYYAFVHQWALHDFLHFGSGYSDQVMRQLEKEYRRLYVEVVANDEGKGDWDASSLSSLNTLATHAYRVWECFPDLAAKSCKEAAMANFNQQEFWDACSHFSKLFEICLGMKDKGKAIPEGVWNRENVEAYLESSYCSGQGTVKEYVSLEKLEGFPGSKVQETLASIPQLIKGGEIEKIGEVSNQLIEEGNLKPPEEAEAHFYKIWAMPRSEPQAKISAYKEFLPRLEQLLNECEETKADSSRIRQIKARALNDIGWRCLDVPEHRESAQAYFEGSLLLMEEYPGLANAYTQGANFSGLADYFMGRNEPSFSKALEYNRKNYEVSKDSGLATGIISSTSKMGGILMDQFNRDPNPDILHQAETLYRESLYYSLHPKPQVGGLAFAVLGLTKLALNLQEAPFADNSRLSLLKTELKAIRKEHGGEVGTFINEAKKKDNNKTQPWMLSIEWAWFGTTSEPKLESKSP